MSPVATLLIFLGVVLFAVFAFHALDRWHQRKAWRDAERDADEFMRRRYHVERKPDDGWRNCE